MNHEWEFSSDDFDRFLAWLHADRELAGEKYEVIRRGLLQFFQRRGGSLADAEECADETVRRVVNKVHAIAPSYDGEPARYFYGVAHHVWQEHLRRPTPAQPAPTPDSPVALEQTQQCREQCLQRLSAEEQRMVIEYYKAARHDKARRRRALASQYGLTGNNLTVRVFRLRTALHHCLDKCLEHISADDLFDDVRNPANPA